MPSTYQHRLSELWLTGQWQYWYPQLLKLPLAPAVSVEALCYLERGPQEITQSVQWKNLGYLLNFIASRNDFWKSYLAACGIELDSPLINQDFGSFPVLDKLFYRRTLARAYVTAIPKFSFAHYFTSGSSGIPFQFVLDDLSVFWRSLYALRGNRWAGHQKGDDFIRVFRSNYPDPMRSNVEAHSIFLEWNRIETHYEFMRNQKNPLVLYGFIEYFRELMQHVPSSHTLNIRSMIITGERCGAREREQMESFFRVPVYVSYSSREFGRIAQECEYQDGYHVNAERFFVEVVDNAGRQLPERKTGKILITDARNIVMPFIRFDIGDTGHVSATPCRCGRTLPRLYVEDRSTDRVMLPGGKRMRPFALFALLNQFNWILRYQIVQHSLTDFAILLSALNGPPRDDIRRIKAGLSNILGGSARLNIELTQQDFVLKNGKQLPFISEIAS